MEKDPALDMLNHLGFRLTKIPDSTMGYHLEYEGINMIYHRGDEEDKSIMFIVPGAATITDKNWGAVTDVVLRMSTEIKYAKPIIVDEKTVWITYEHYLGDKEPDEDLLGQMIQVVGAAYVNLIKYLSYCDDDEEDNEEDDEEDDEEGDDFLDDDEDDDEEDDDEFLDDDDDDEYDGDEDDLPF